MFSSNFDCKGVTAPINEESAWAEKALAHAIRVKVFSLLSWKKLLLAGLMLFRVDRCADSLVRERTESEWPKNHLSLVFTIGPPDVQSLCRFLCIEGKI